MDVSMYMEMVFSKMFSISLVGEVSCFWSKGQCICKQLMNQSEKTTENHKYDSNVHAQEKD